MAAELKEMNAIIKIEELKKKYGDFTAVDGLEFEISENEIFGLLGPNGAGKTTTINMICGLLPPTSGKISFNRSNADDQKTLIGYCPQENVIYPRLTCLEQLLFTGNMFGFSSKNARTRANDLLKLLGLSEKSNVIAGKLSGGMKRRLNICLALIHNPDIVILDEPEAGLDPQGRVMIRDFIKALGREKTVILSTHNMDEADRLADRVAIIDHGKLLLLDTPRNLKSTVGEGDMLELALEDLTDNSITLFIQSLNSLSISFSISNKTILLKHPNILDQISAVRSKAEESGLKVSEIRLRENSLEDVFIHLTGRNLRQ